MNKSEATRPTDKPTLKALEEAGETKFVPSDFMRARHPDLFSDTKTLTEPHLTSKIFEYHLQTLTSRKDEIAFEHFCRRLAEKEICPNLLPQTGPTGGGDSLVDSETYPVASSIAQNWYEGIGQEASQERWAFAFSAKAKWQPKVVSDVEKIIGSGREYRKIFFITNQFIPDKKRAEVEDRLSRQHGTQVRILDRTWLVSRVVEHKRIALAIETLNLSEFASDTVQVLGPHDTEREGELQELDRQIDDAHRYQGVEYQLAEDCLTTALLARGLEYPRVEIEGRFDRAERIARKVDDRQQLLRIAYNRAWTTFWWFNDYLEFNTLYDRVESLALSSNHASDLELICNLWMLLRPTVSRGELDAQTAKFDDRTKRLKDALERLAADKKRPNNALTARTHLLLVDLYDCLFEKKVPDPILIELRKALARSRGLAEYPLQTITRAVKELGNVMPDNEEYDKLFELVIRLTEQRTSEGEAGIILIERGGQKLRAGKTYDAIRILGRAQQKLAVDEYRSAWTAALAGCGLAYEKAGLLWAARSNMLAAANHALSRYWKQGELTPQALRYVKKLVWIEIELGRIFPALAWLRVETGIAHKLMLEGEAREAFLNERITQDRVLAMLLLKTDLWQLKWLDFLPPLLDEQDLDYSWMALLYALGYEDYLRSEDTIPDSETPQAVREFFLKWLKQPAKDDLPDKPELMRDEKIWLRSFVLGCRVIVEVHNNPVSLSLAEALLGSLEALLATSLEELIPYRSELLITVRPSVFLTSTPNYQIDESSGGEVINVYHPAKMEMSSLEEREAFHTWLVDFVVHASLQIGVPGDAHLFTKRVLEKERGLGRAVLSADISIAVENILGESPKFTLSDWEASAESQRFPLLRNQPWDYGHESPKAEVKTFGEMHFGTRNPPEGLFGIDQLRHQDRPIFSLINLPLWDKANWMAMAFGDASVEIPVLGLAFKDVEAGKMIFQGWQKKLGSVDGNELLRVTIVTGVNRKHPADYRVLISINPQLETDGHGRQFVLTARIQTMHPSDGTNLNRFLEHYRRAGRYILTPAFAVSEIELGDHFLEPTIEKKVLNIRAAWEIGSNDPDVSAIFDNDDPIIPIQVTEAPVKEALNRHHKDRKKRKRA